MTVEMFLFYNQIKNSKLLNLSLAFFLWVIIATQCRIGMIPSCLDVDICEKINNISFAIASSYVAGYIFYILTVVIPYVKTYASIHSEISELFRRIIDEFRDMSGELCGGDWLNDVSLKEDAVNGLIYDKNNNCVMEERQRIEFFEKILAIHIVTIDSYLNQLVNHYNYLNLDTRRILVEMKTSKSFQKCRMFNNTTELLDKDKCEELVSGLINYNFRMCREYEKML